MAFTKRMSNADLAALKLKRDQCYQKLQQATIAAHEATHQKETLEREYAELSAQVSRADFARLGSSESP